jgi:hypothetical protein
MTMFLWLGGADKAVLERCPSERGRIAALGGAVLMTALLAAIAATIATKQWLHISLPVALALGLFWGASIMNLDRWLLMTLRRQSKPIFTVLLALPRVALALVVGLVISQPLLQTVFKSEVSAQAIQDRQSEYGQARASLADNYRRIQTLTAKKETLERSGEASAESTALAASPDYRQAVRAVHSQQVALEGARHAAICELDGLCGTRQRGAGPSYRAKEQEVAVRSSEFERSQQALHQLEGTVLSEARASQSTTRRYADAQLKETDQELASLNHDYQTSNASLLKAYSAPVGPLDRIDALGKLTAKHPSMRYMAWLLTLFVLLIDTVPVVFKTLTLLGRRSVYEQLQDDLEDRQLRRRSVAEDMRDAAHEVDTAIILEEAQLEHKHRLAVLQERAGAQLELERELTRRLVPELRDGMFARLPDLVTLHLCRQAIPRSRRRDAAAPGYAGEPSQSPTARVL